MLWRRREEENIEKGKNNCEGERSNQKLDEDFVRHEQEDVCHLNE